MEFIVYSALPSKRLNYILDTVFGQFLGQTYILLTDQQTYINASGPKINYSKCRLLKEELFLPACDLLFENSIQQQEIQSTQFKDLPALFPILIPDSDLNFDFLSMAFYLLSRYEEYLPFTSDAHSRFPAKSSVAYQKGFLKFPLVDLLLVELINLIQQKYPNFKPAARSFRFQATYDIDMAWAYKHKGFARLALSNFKSLIKGDINNLRRQVKVLSGKVIDPFFTFDYLDRLHQQHNIEPIYFFLLANYAQYDKNVSHKVPAFQQLIKRISSHYNTGIHPSYASNQNPILLKKEINRLQKITGSPVVKSRQHYLKLHLPRTYQDLLDQGIHQDYSMGYASEIGFRASTAKSFYWFDLEKSQSTELMIHPFQVMDVTLKEYLNLGPEEAVEELNPMIQLVKQTAGTFCTLWHNSSFSAIGDWENWRDTYEAIIKLAKEAEEV